MGVLGDPIYDHIELYVLEAEDWIVVLEKSGGRDSLGIGSGFGRCNATYQLSYLLHFGLELIQLCLKFVIQSL